MKPLVPLLSLLLCQTGHSGTFVLDRQSVRALDNGHTTYFPPENKPDITIRVLSDGTIETLNKNKDFSNLGSRLTYGAMTTYRADKQPTGALVTVHKLVNNWHETTNGSETCTFSQNECKGEYWDRILLPPGGFSIYTNLPREIDFTDVSDERVQINFSIDYGLSHSLVGWAGFGVQGSAYYVRRKPSISISLDRNVVQVSAPFGSSAETTVTATTNSDPDIEYSITWPAVDGVEYKCGAGWVETVNSDRRTGAGGTDMVTQTIRVSGKRPGSVSISIPVTVSLT